MSTAARLVRAYLIILFVLVLAVAGLGRSVGPTELLLFLVIAIAVAAYSTKKIRRTATQNHLRP